MNILPVLKPEEIFDLRDRSIRQREHVYDIMRGEEGERIKAFLSEFVSRRNSFYFEPGELRALPEIGNKFKYSRSFRMEWAYRRQSLEMIRPFLRTPATVLEIGPWNGWLTNRMKREEGKKREVVAIDYFMDEPDGLLTHKHYPCDWLCIQADLLDLPPVIKKFDLIVFNHNFQFLPDHHNFVGKFKNHLEPGGKIILLGLSFFKPGKNGFLPQDMFIHPCKSYLDESDRELILKNGFMLKAYPYNLIDSVLGRRKRYMAVTERGF